MSYDNTGMQPSQDGLHFTEVEEGGKPNADGTYSAYWDNLGQVWTIADGLTGTMQDGTPIAAGLVLTQAQVDAETLARYAKIVTAVNEAVTGVQLSQGESDALYDFVWNVGLGAFLGSTMLKDLNRGDVLDAEGEFPKWDKAGGAVVQGLLNRRIAEQKEFDS